MKMLPKGKLLWNHSIFRRQISRRRAVHLCIDMQLMFAVGTKWSSPAIWEAVPAIKGYLRPLRRKHRIYSVYLSQ
jgi:hypothetical protein